MSENKRNILYEVKKHLNTREHHFYQPNRQEDDIREENKKLRTELRSKETDIIRLKAMIDDKNQKLETMNKSMSTTLFWNQKKQKTEQVFGEISFCIENKNLKETNEILNQENLQLNKKNNLLQAQLRQIKSEKYSLQIRVKELNIIQQMRQQRFKDQFQRLTPIIIQEPVEVSTIRNKVKQLQENLRKCVVKVVEEIFLQGVKQCGFESAVKAYTQVHKYGKIIDEKQEDLDQFDENIQGTIDNWIVGSILQIKSAKGVKQICRKLFRLLGLKYRIKFPIKFQKHQIEQKTKNQLDHQICKQIQLLLNQSNKKLKK